VIKSELTAFGIPTWVKLAPDYATYLADIYRADYAVGFWLTSIGPSIYSVFNRIYGIYDGYIPDGAMLRHYPTRPPTIS
jgi:peptide/nickel transport system substrate-binding protein